MVQVGVVDSKGPTHISRVESRRAADHDFARDDLRMWRVGGLELAEDLAFSQGPTFIGDAWGVRSETREHDLTDQVNALGDVDPCPPLEVLQQPDLDQAHNVLHEGVGVEPILDEVRDRELESEVWRAV